MKLEENSVFCIEIVLDLNCIIILHQPKVRYATRRGQKVYSSVGDAARRCTKLEIFMHSHLLSVSKVRTFVSFAFSTLIRKPFRVC